MVDFKLVRTAYSTDSIITIRSAVFSIDIRKKTAEIIRSSPVYYTICICISGIAGEGSIIIPASITYQGINYDVTSIGNDAFNSNNSLTMVSMPNSITSIGANATVVCGHKIGKWALIGAGGVVTSNVPAHALMLGVPARRMGWACECGELLPKDLVCEKCGRKYRETDEGLEEVK